MSGTPLPPPPPPAPSSAADASGAVPAIPDAMPSVNSLQSAMEGLPKKFGKYTLLRKLATGGMAELYLAIQRSVAGFEKLLVIKRILPSMNRDRAFIDMFLHEARIAATLSHPNIVQIFDVGQEGGTYFIAMEHVHGEDLRSMVRQMKKKGVAEFPLEHAVGIVLQMCAGLAYAHEKKDLDGTPLNIVHRDISPQNVLVGFSGDVKIVDFGIAKSDSKLLQEETKDGKLKGKVPYMSPEQARGQHVDWRTDIFATGVMLFELTTGKRLFKGASEYETLKMICEREYPLPSMVRAGYPPELELIVMRALQKDRDDRFQTAREMQGALEEYTRSSGLRVSTLALTEFMEHLFEGKLAVQKEALLQGKALADVIELERIERPEDSSPGDGRSSGAPGMSATLTDFGVRRRKDRGGAGFALGVVAALVLIVGIGGIATFVMRKQAAKTPMITTVTPTKRGAITVNTSPPGAAIWLDGDLRAEATPATIDQLPLNAPVTLRFTKDGYEQEKQTVTLTDAAPTSTLAITMHPGSVVADVTVTPADAVPTYTLDGNQVNGPTIDGVTSDLPHALVIDAPGYKSETLNFTGTAFEHKKLDVTLTKVGGDATALNGHGGKVHGNHGNGTTTNGGGAAPAPAGNGKLNVGASGGWCNLAVDGATRGATPVAAIELSAGFHRLTCTTSDGKAMSATVNVVADSTTRYKFTIN